MKQVFFENNAPGISHLKILPTREIGDSEFKINVVDTQLLPNGIMVRGNAYVFTQIFCKL